MNIFIIPAFAKLREVLATNKALAQRIEQLAVTQKDHTDLFDIVMKDIEALDKKFTKEIRQLKAPCPASPASASTFPKKNGEKLNGKVVAVA